MMFENMLLPMHILIVDWLIDLSLSYLRAVLERLPSIKHLKKSCEIKENCLKYFSQPEPLPGRVPAASRGLASAAMLRAKEKIETQRCKFPFECQKLLREILTGRVELSLLMEKENT